MTKILILCLLFCHSLSSFAEEQTWYFIRHFEKLSGDDPQLSELGKQRAEALVQALNNKPISHIYSTAYNRTLDSVSPLAVDRGLSPILYDPTQLAQLAQQLAQRNHVIVVGHSNTTGQLIRLMGGVIDNLTEQDYGQLFILSKVHGKLELQSQILRAK
ncbi:MAG: histidine phosphatase family protein [Paraglaciecola sp.]|nr:histidine phosphatase family protein [Paraglaciecola sp.]